jgi:hypothetical protein
METEKSLKSANIFKCEKCDFECSKMSGWLRHVSTAKHTFQPKVIIIVQKKSLKICECGKQFSERSGLWKHAKKCILKKCAEKVVENVDIKEDLDENVFNTKEDEDEDVNFDKDKIDTNALILQLLKQNQELQRSLIEISKERVITNNTNNTNNSNNTNNTKTFNLQFFLNEQCKDALNIGEFVDSIKIQISDLEATGRQGYVEGITCIINKNLDKLDKCKRPIHCTDLKREVLYIKNNDEWVKEDSTTPLLKKAIKDIAFKNILQINEWRKLHPDCNQSDSRKNDLYLKIVSNAMSGSTTEEQLKNYDKIVSNIIKGVVIVK